MQSTTDWLYMNVFIYNQSAVDCILRLGLMVQLLARLPYILLFSCGCVLFVQEGAIFFVLFSK